MHPFEREHVGAMARTDGYLAPRFRVFAPDSYDSGKSPHWPSDRAIHLRDEVALIEPVLARAGSPLALIGHSYGAAVALIAALTDPGRVRAMALYEPTLFALLDAETPPPNEADGIRDAVIEAGVALDKGNRDAAAERSHRLLDGNRELDPDARATEAALGHMGPVTHPDVVNEAIGQFLERTHHSVPLRYRASP